MYRRAGSNNLWVKALAMLLILVSFIMIFFGWVGVKVYGYKLKDITDSASKMEQYLDVGSIDEAISYLEDELSYSGSEYGISVKGVVSVARSVLSLGGLSPLNTVNGCIQLNKILGAVKRTDSYSNESFVEEYGNLKTTSFIAALFLALLLIVCVFSLGLAAYGMLKDKKHAVTFYAGAYTLLFLIFLIIAVVGSSKLRSATSGYGELYLMGAPIIGLVCAIGAFAVWFFLGSGVAVTAGGSGARGGAGLRCPACGNALAPGARFCTACGYTLAAAPAGGWSCSACGGNNPDSAGFCTKCGRPKTVASPPGGWSCPNCGSNNPDSAGFCTKCGQRKSVAPTPPPSGWSCPNCGSNNPDNSAFCTNCGQRKSAAPTPPPSGWSCPNCGSNNPDSSAFCTNCGRPKGSVAPPPPTGWLCKVCGTDNPEGMNYCRSCGQPRYPVTPSDPPPEPARTGDITTAPDSPFKPPKMF